jgi:acyl-CoA thioesterase
MTALADVIAGLERVDDGWRGEVPDNWLQGRTAYGGFSSALALHAAQASDVDLPPLRSAQVSFIGPLSGAVTVRAQRLRRGRNAAFVQADVTSEAGLGLRATFVFMAAIPSAITHAEGTAPAFPPPGPEAEVWRGRPEVRFTQNFESLRRKEGTGPAEWQSWTRLASRDGLDPMVELIAIADALPPAAAKLLDRPVPLSSMTWLLNILTPRPQTTDGWWLVQAAADHARDGNSSQTMRIWNADGQPIAEQMQSVAIFA